MDKVVRIIEDCRKTDKPANGQLGMYEGDFPRTVIKVFKDYWTKEQKFQEFMYDWWMTSGWPEHIPQYTGQEPKPDCYWFLHKNPRIRLADGSYIWGDECWWSPEVDTSLEQLQKEVDLFREVFLAMLAAEAQPK